MARVESNRCVMNAILMGQRAWHGVSRPADSASPRELSTQLAGSTARLVPARFTPSPTPRPPPLYFPPLTPPPRLFPSSRIAPRACKILNNLLLLLLSYSSSSSSLGAAIHAIAHALLVVDDVFLLQRAVGRKSVHILSVSHTESHSLLLTSPSNMSLPTKHAHRNPETKLRGTMMSKVWSEIVPQ